MTVVIQYEYYNLNINTNNFSITLSFNDVKANLKIGYDSILSFADPSANFGLILKKKEKPKKNSNRLRNIKSKDNVIEFSDYKKN